MDEKFEKALKQLTTTLAQKDVYSLEVSGKCGDDGVLEIPVKNKPQLKRSINYKISLVSLNTVSFFPNLTEKNNKFYYKTDADAQIKTITLDTGGYNIADYNEAIKMMIKSNGDNPENIRIQLMASGKTAVILVGNYQVHFSSDDTWRDVLGFPSADLTTNGVHLSEKIADVVPVQKVYVKCNLCSGSIFNGEESNILFSFPNSKKYGSVLNLTPNPLVPLKLSTTNVDKIRLEFIDEDNEPVNFLRSNVCCQLLIEQF